MPRLITTPLVFFLRNREILEERVISENGAEKTVYVREYPSQKQWANQRDPSDNRDYYVFSVTYSKPFDKNWTDSELLSAIVKLNCRGNSRVKLASLPDLPNCKTLNCRFNALTSLPQLDACIELDCSNNALTSLGPLPDRLSEGQAIGDFHVNLPKCRILVCSENQIREIGPLPSCKTLSYNGNPVTFIHPLPYGENIQGDDRREYRGNLICYWRIRWYYLKEKYFRLWYLAMIKRKAITKKDLHEEMKFSPDTLIENEYTLAKKSFDAHLSEHRGSENKYD